MHKLLHIFSLFCIPLMNIRDFSLIREKMMVLAKCRTNTAFSILSHARKDLFLLLPHKQFSIHYYYFFFPTDNHHFSYPVLGMKHLLGIYTTSCKKNP